MASGLKVPGPDLGPRAGVARARCGSDLGVYSLDVLGVMAMTLGLQLQASGDSTDPPPRPAAVPTRPRPAASAGKTPPSSPPPPHPARVHWVDGVFTGALLATLGVLKFWDIPKSDAVPSPPTDRSADVGRADAVAIGHFRPQALHASDIVLGIGVAAPFVFHGIEAAVVRDRFAARFGTDALLLAETLAVNSMTTLLLKVAVQRPRPLVYTDPATLENDEDAQSLRSAQRSGSAYESFPSGHTSLAFAAAVGGSTLLTMKWARGTRRQRIGLGFVWGLSLAAASTTAALRVVGGKHFPTDVVAGAVLGSGVGVVVPLLHSRRRLHRRSFSLAPSVGRHTRGVSLSARF